MIYELDMERLHKPKDRGYRLGKTFDAVVSMCHQFDFVEQVPDPEDPEDWDYEKLNAFYICSSLEHGHAVLDMARRYLDDQGINYMQTVPNYLLIKDGDGTTKGSITCATGGKLRRSILGTDNALLFIDHSVVPAERNHLLEHFRVDGF